MTETDLKELRLRLGRTQQGMATILGTSLRSYQRWEQGGTPLKIYQQRIDRLKRFVEGGTK